MALVDKEEYRFVVNLCSALWSIFISYIDFKYYSMIMYAQLVTTIESPFCCHSNVIILHGDTCAATTPRSSNVTGEESS
jgi:hypothetical protein